MNKNIQIIISSKLKAQGLKLYAFNFQLLTLSFLLLAFSFQLSANSVSAAPSSLSIRPSIISLSLSPGKTSHTPLSIINNGVSPLPIRLRFEPLSTLSDTSVRPLQSIERWISLSSSSLLIPSQQEKIIDVQIALPKTISLGGYYGMIYVEQLAPSQTSSGSVVLTKMGVLVLGSVGVQEVPLNSIEIQKLTLANSISETSTLQLSFDVKNAALNHISAKSYLKIHPLLGKEETVQLDEKLVFPGTKRGWNTSFSVQKDRQLYYAADLYVSIGNGLTQKKSFSFVIFPVQQAIILVLCIAIGISIVRKRKQIKQAVEIMVRG